MNFGLRKDQMNMNFGLRKDRPNMYFQSHSQLGGRKELIDRAAYEKIK